MRVAIIGLPNAGKTTLFNALTGQRRETTCYPTASGDPHVGIVNIPDTRLETLTTAFKPKKATPATIEFVDVIGLTKDNPKQNKQVFDVIKDADALLQVVRYFTDDAVMHPLGSIDVRRDISVIESELVYADLELIEKRLERMEEGLKRGKKPDESEKALLLKCREILTEERPLRDVPFSEEDVRTMKHLQFYSIIPEIVVLNCGEDETTSGACQSTATELSAAHRSLTFLPVCGKLEMEIAYLSPEDRKGFLELMGISEPAANRLIRACLDLLGFITFFTYAGDEVRAWTVKSGTHAQKAAGKVHSDIERGFIRAEVMSFDDFVSAGDIHRVREKGLLRLEGKAYEVRDGDIITFRFNV